MKSSPRALLGEKCGFVGCQEIENPELETVWKRFCSKLFPAKKAKNTVFA